MRAFVDGAADAQGLGLGKRRRGEMLPVGGYASRTGEMRRVTDLQSAKGHYGHTSAMEKRSLYTHLLHPISSMQARGSDLRVHFKNTRESAAAIKGMPVCRVFESCSILPQSFL